LKVIPLLAIPSPRDLVQFHQAIEKVTDIDKLWIKYCPSPITYPTIRKEFLSNKSNQKYTHLIICPDDLVIDRQKLQYLIDDYQNLLSKEEQDTTIISGFCNVDDSDHSHEANICMEYVTPRRQGRRYNWVKMTSIDAIKGQIERARLDKSGLEDRMQAGQETITHEDDINPNEFNKQFLLNVKFAGFGMIMIPRAILKNTVDMRNDAVGYPVKKEQGCCEDVMLCHQCLEKGYKIYVDVRAQFQHLKLNDRDTRRLLMANEAQKLTPYIKYEHYSNNKKTVSKEVEIKDPELDLHATTTTKPEHYIYGSSLH